MELQGKLHAQAAFLQTEPLVLIQLESGWDPQPFWVGPTTVLDVSDENILSVFGIEPRFLGCPARDLVTILTTLSQLQIRRTSPNKRAFLEEFIDAQLI
jgi:hypothetical protein